MTSFHAKALRKQADAIVAATAERNRLILVAHRQGWSLREIAEHAGITHVAVRKIILKAGKQR